MNCFHAPEVEENINGMHKIISLDLHVTYITGSNNKVTFQTGHAHSISIFLIILVHMPLKYVDMIRYLYLLVCI